MSIEEQLKELQELIEERDKKLAKLSERMAELRAFQEEVKKSFSL